MAVKTYRMANTFVDNFHELLEVDQVAATTATGWTVAKNAGGNSSDMDSAAEAITFTSNATNPKPIAPQTTSGNGFRPTAQVDGVFANTDWSIVLVWRSVSNAHSGTLRSRIRVFHSANSNGTSSVELTGSTQVGTTSGVGSTTVDVTSTVTWSPGGVIDLTGGRYLFITVAIEVVTASGNNSADALVRTGSGVATGTRIVTSDFTPTGGGGGATEDPPSYMGGGYYGMIRDKLTGLWLPKKPQILVPTF